jgi:hypothetical protein
MSKDERAVMLQGPEDIATAVDLVTQHSTIGIGAGAVPKFKEVEDYTTFFAEYDLISGNIVIHFFPPKDQKVTQDYWMVKFAEALDVTAQEHFQATKPRLAAKYTEEMSSWWFRAQGFGHLIDVDQFLTRFFEKLDAALDPHLPRPTLQ